jgi:phosphatidylinositol alpha-mannosyltransferase
LTLQITGLGHRLIGTFHATSDTNLGYALFQRPLGRLAERLDARIAVSESAARFAGRYFPARYDIVPNGIDCERFSPHIEPIAKWVDDRFNVLFVGRMDRRKGIADLFRAVAAAQKRSRRGIRLILVGEGAMRRLFIRKPHDFGGAEIVTTGRIDPELIPRYYATADVVCSPATGQESFGIVLLEAMASGVPVIASDIAGFRTVVTHGREGFLTPPHSPRAVAEAILELEADPSLREELGSRGRKKSLSYDWPAVIDSLERLLCRIVGSDGAAEEATRHAQRITG